jgi:hypothetical protein
LELDMSEGENNEKDTAMLRLVNLMYDTPTGLEGLINEKIAELTDIPERLINHLALQMTREVALSEERQKLGIRLSKVWRVCYMMLRRSRGRKQLLTGIGLAESQLTIQAEDESETFEMKG